MAIEIKRDWQQREIRLVAEYLQARHLNDRVQTRVRLGPIQPRLGNGFYANDAEMKMAGIWRRWADAIIVQKDQVIILEASIRPDAGKIMQLILYRDLFSQTPEFDYARHLPIKLIILFAIEDLQIRKLAQRYEIAVDFYQPKWVLEYLDLLLPREKRSPQLNLGLNVV